MKVCGPEGNRTLHSLLAREKRQALEHASPIKLFYKWKAVKPPQLLAGWDSNHGHLHLQCSALPTELSAQT